MIWRQTTPSRSIAAVLALLASTLVSAQGAFAAELPPIKVTDSNKVLSCATPGRLMKYLKANNANFPERFETIGSDYMRHGEELGIRWDYAFFQMLVETGYLKFTGDVDVSQNNFAGLGATGKGAKGESFPDVSTGVRAHLQHIVMYTGTPVENPVAQRTRDVQAWGVLTKWQQGIKRPMTFKDLTSKWAPTSKAYPRDILSVAKRFEDGICKEDDPQPDLVASARDGAAADVAETPPAAPSKSAAASKSDSASPPPAAKSEAQLDLKVINQPSDGAAEAKTDAPAADTSKATAAAASQKAEGAGKASDKAESKPGKGDKKTFETAAVAGAATAAATASPANPAKCKVWQASYGGSKAIIIKAQAEKMTNYTVLDVNDGSEKREAEAYIAAYAKGGATVGEFDSSSQALEKAFQLCPEG